MNENEISSRIIGTAIKLHKELGPGLLESVYEKSLAYELNNSGLYIKTQVPVPFEALARFFAQLLTYLKITNLKLGLLINFNVKLLKEGINRIANNL
jgi:hypothetical protein